MDAIDYAEKYTKKYLTTSFVLPIIKKV